MAIFSKRALTAEEAEKALAEQARRATHYYILQPIGAEMFNFHPKQIVAVYPDAPPAAHALFEALVTVPIEDGTFRAKVITSLPWGCEPFVVDRNFRMSPPPPQPRPVPLTKAEVMKRCKFASEAQFIAARRLGFPKASLERIEERDGVVMAREPLWAAKDIDNWLAEMEAANAGR